MGNGIFQGLFHYQILTAYSHFKHLHELSICIKTSTTTPKVEWINGCLARLGKCLYKCMNRTHILVMSLWLVTNQIFCWYISISGESWKFFWFGTFMLQHSSEENVRFGILTPMTLISNWILEPLYEFIRVIPKVTLSSPCLWASFHPLSPLSWYLQSKDILINLSMKCWYEAFNAQGSRLIIVVVQLGAVKIYVAARQALRKKDRQDERQVYHQNWWFSEFHPPLNANVLFCRFILNLTLCMTTLRVRALCFSYFPDNSIIWNFFHDKYNIRRFFCREISPLGYKKEELQHLPRIFGGGISQIPHILRNFCWIAIFRLYVLACHQHIARFQKSCIFLSHL